MTASINDKITKVGLPGSATTLASPGYTMGATSINLTSSTNWETTTAVHFDMYTTEISGNEEVEVANTRTSWKAVLSGTTLSSLQLKYGTDQNYAAGTNTKVVITPSTIRENEIADHILTEHAQDGTHDPTKVAMLAGTQTFTGNKTFSGTVTLPNNSVDANELSTTAISLASINSSTGQTGITSTPVLVTGLTTTVTIPAGGRKVRVEASIPLVSCTNIATVTLYIYNGTTVAGTLLQSEGFLIAIAGTGNKMSISYEYTPSAGSQSYCLGISTDTGTANTSSLGATRQANFSVKVI